MMTFHKTASLDQSRARHSQDDARLPIGTSIMIWLILTGVCWLGILGATGLF